MAQPEYPKIIRRPAKPPEEYAYIDVSVNNAFKTIMFNVSYLMRTNHLFQKIIFPLPAVECN